MMYGIKWISNGLVGCVTDTGGGAIFQEFRFPDDFPVEKNVIFYEEDDKFIFVKKI